jgi:uncharacterized short protein YbdD (DUF466 family)
LTPDIPWLTVSTVSEFTHDRQVARCGLLTAKRCGRCGDTL